MTVIASPSAWLVASLHAYVDAASTVTDTSDWGMFQAVQLAC